jgi:hypothetical protein
MEVERRRGRKGMSGATDGNPAKPARMRAATDGNPSKSTLMRATTDGIPTATRSGLPRRGRCAGETTKEEGSTKEIYEIRTVQGEACEKTSLAGQRWAGLGIGEITVN